MRTVTVSRGAWVLLFRQFSVCRLTSHVGIGEGVLGVVGISRNGSGAGTFPDIEPVASKGMCSQVGVGVGIRG